MNDSIKASRRVHRRNAWNFRAAQWVARKA